MVRIHHVRHSIYRAGSKRATTPINEYIVRRRLGLLNRKPLHVNGEVSTGVEIVAMMRKFRGTRSRRDLSSDCLRTTNALGNEYEATVVQYRIVFFT
jgi:hypothetical protein